MWSALDSLLDRAHIVGSIEAVHGQAELFEQLPHRLAAVTEADVAAAAADLVSQHRAVVELVPPGTN
jgi:predicted Zn-dependent peptidase